MKFHFMFLLLFDSGWQVVQPVKQRVHDCSIVNGRDAYRIKTMRYRGHQTDLEIYMMKLLVLSSVLK